MNEDDFDLVWTDKPTYSYRWIKKFAWYPIKTFDAGWILFKPYWLWEMIWGWGFNEKHPYVNKHSKELDKSL